MNLDAEKCCVGLSSARRKLANRREYLSVSEVANRSNFFKKMRFSREMGASFKCRAVILRQVGSCEQVTLIFFYHD